MKNPRKNETTSISNFADKYPFTSFVSITPVSVDEWVVQGSVLNNDVICIIIYHANNFKTYIRYFTDEVKANEFVMKIIEDDQDVPEKSSDETGSDR